MQITNENCGNMLCLYHTGKRIRILEVDERTITYEEEHGRRYATFETCADAFVDKDAERTARFDQNCKLGRALSAAEFCALRTLYSNPSIPAEERQEMDRVLHVVRTQQDALSHRMSEERRTECPGTALASAFLSQLYEQGTGSHDTFFGHRVENVGQISGTFSINGQRFDYSAALDWLSRTPYREPAKGLDAQISDAARHKNEAKRNIQYKSLTARDR